MAKGKGSLNGSTSRKSTDVFGLGGVGKHVTSDRKRIGLMELMGILSTSLLPTPNSYFVALRNPPLAFLQVLDPWSLEA